MKRLDLMIKSLLVPVLFLSVNKKIVFGSIFSLMLVVPQQSISGVIPILDDGTTDDGTTDDGTTDDGTTDDGTTDDGTIDSSTSDDDDAVSTADDLCYDWIDYSVDGMGMCIDMGVVKGGVNCKQTISIRNQGDDELTDVKVVINTTGMMSGSFLSDCGIDGESENGEACEEDNMFDMGVMGIFGSGVVYDPMPDYAPDDSHTIYDKALVSMAIFNTENLYGYYTKNDTTYIGEIYECGKSGGDYQVGRIDGWDTFRDEDTPPDDVNISTKISAKPFKVVVATMDEERTKYQTLPGSGDIEFGIYEDETTNLISDRTDVLANGENHEESEEFKVNKAVRVARIGFKLCLVHEYDTTTGEEIYQLHPAEDCEDDEPVACNVRTKNGVPTWHVCYSTDKFAVRPNNFELIEPSNFASDEDINLMRSAKDYNFTVEAVDENNNSTLLYDQNKSKLDINTTKLTRDGEEDSSLSGTISFADNDFKFVDGNSTDDDGNHEVVGLSFNDVGLISINIIDKDWASEDADDTPQDCEGGEVNGKDVPYGAFICSEKNATFIPTYFKVVDVNVTNRVKGANFTYLSSDLNMSAHVELRVEAMNAKDEIVRNFTENNTTYWENPVEINITVPSIIKFSNIDEADKNMTIVDKNVSRDILGFGGEDENGTHTISWNEDDESQRLLFNYKRDNSIPVNPFDINGSDVDVNVTSIYSSSTGKVALIKGGSSSEMNATFIYARTKATKELYDDIVDDSVDTPIKVEVYCDSYPASINCPGVDTLFGKTNDYKWYISTSHDMDQKDGYISISIDEGSLNKDMVDIKLANEGIDTDVVVTKASDAALPAISTIRMDGADTSSWLKYTPTLQYKVRFVGGSNWTGVGKTGNVVGTEASKKKSKRMDW